ncbi:MAG: DUF4863 family protein [Gammaproteobacteria bacterium]|nr:MAG: DUF4863 family protein [Gammaproteobacteria bacterium]
MSKAEFREQIQALTSQLAGRELNQDLQQWLNAEHGPDSDTFRQLAEACRQGVDDGWLCQHEAGGIRYGRVFKPEADLQGFSVDVVDMNDCAGPHHRHPTGEIDLVVPLEGDAKFDDHPAGWVVYAADTAHVPTVTHGRALVLYLLPDGRIEFTR